MSLSQQNTANVRLTFGDINHERRTMPLVSLAETQLDLNDALSVIESLVEHCIIHQISGSALVRAQHLLAEHTEMQAAFYGGAE